MVVLALETVTPAGSLALWRDGDTHAAVGDAQVPHAVRLPGVLDEWLGAHGFTLDDVDRLAVVAGPGSFTGVRIGMACAQGLAVTRGWQVAAVSTLDAIAEGWRVHASTGALGTLVPCLDGMRGEVFTSVLTWNGHEFRTLAEPTVHAPDAAWLNTLPRPRIVIGSGAMRYAAVWREAADDVLDVCEPLALSAARLAAQPAWPLAAPDALQPVYVRRPDVELARERAGRP